MKPTLALAPLALAAALAVACGDGRTSLDVALDARAAEAPIAKKPLDERLAEAPERIAYHGRRRVRQTFEIAGSPREVEYLEAVTANGRGGFAVAIEDVVVPVLSQVEQQVFIALQENRQAFLYENRDFRIRSLELFRELYEIRQVGENVEVAGRECFRLEVRRHASARRSYELAVDVETGLVLRSEERSIDGRLLSSAEFQTFALGAPPEGTPMYERPFERRRIDPEVPTAEQVGFPPLRPTLVPEGYRLVKIDYVPVVLEDGGDQRNWLRFVYEDGVEQLYFLHSPEPSANGLTQAKVPTASALMATTTPAFREDRVMLAEIGPWRVVDGSVRGQGIVAMGKVPEQQLLQFVQSALAHER